MEIIKKISAKSRKLYDEKIPVIAFLGDSVTQGCFEIYKKSDGNIETVFDPEHSYHRYLAKILAEIFPNVPISIINAGLSGDRAEGGYARLERDVLRYKPDLTVVCFGLNDCRGGMDYLDTYIEYLTKIFTTLKSNGSEVIFMTPNMMCTNISCHIKEKSFIAVAKETASAQNEGILDKYVLEARKTANQLGVAVCDVYGKWKKMNSYGVDTTNLLANYINHPNRQMNKIFAYSLIETMFEYEN